MNYFLKKNVTNNMLIALGFRIVFDYELRAIKTLETRSIFIEKTNRVVVWDKKDIQDLIDLEYVEEK